MVPEVKKCMVGQCFYNRDQECRAHGITVGSDKPLCETFVQTMSHSEKQGASEVGACHVTQCSFNDSMYCHACDDIVVDLVGDSAMCTTFRAK